MRRRFSPGPVSLAVLMAMLAHGALAEDKPSGHEAADGHTAAATETHADAAQAGDAHADMAETANDTGAEAQAPIGVTAPSSGAGDSGFPMAGNMEALEPYKLLRSLQFVQDSVVQGDHSAMEMQRYLLGVIDKRLRQAEQKVFDDPRNVDAALIYAMSGGNPETLEILALNDKFGNFDNEVTTVLRAYLSGRAARTRTTLDEVVKVYRDTDIGPYLTLVAANVMAATNDAAALDMFDWARLAAPGTLVEEAALRRSLFISANKNLVERALDYAQLYARRFINSPYAGQYADLLVDLVVLHYDKVGEDRLNQILSFMDAPRKREVYLRIARKAAISGLRDLAVIASDKAEALLTPSDIAPQALADLYSGMAKIPTDGVASVLADINGVSNRQLSARDKALRAAAVIIAEEVIRKPDPNSFTQALSPNVQAPDLAEAGQVPDGADGMPDPGDDTAQLSPEEEETAAKDNVFRAYVSDRKQTLERIDKMLEGVEEDKGS
ncbi:chemotaxis protein [Hoeflea ulvae]|uniref:Chemotaxis protein n=1 Tax=Hoeflea ulvae TaxID=2983764 RepID=A0ABT3YCB1_9HYPH|nr:chemotaxis protein [Hoeflea ulvae]MCY0093526.1 chemotaxis protein [Hoeflea ulvae]